jgi:hypothetical protein
MLVKMESSLVAAIILQTLQFLWYVVDNSSYFAVTTVSNNFYRIVALGKRTASQLILLF